MDHKNYITGSNLSPVLKEMLLDILQVGHKELGRCILFHLACARIIYKKHNSDSGPTDQNENLILS